MELQEADLTLGLIQKLIHLLIKCTCLIRITSYNVCYTKLLRKETIQLASINDKNGLFVLTSQGGERLGVQRWVEVNFDVKKGSLFAPGFKDADESISVNDEVVIVKEGKVLGVGRALMSGKEMKKAKP